MVAKKFRIGEVDWCAGLTQPLVQENKILGSVRFISDKKFYLIGNKSLRTIPAIFFVFIIMQKSINLSNKFCIELTRKQSLNFDCFF